MPHLRDLSLTQVHSLVANGSYSYSQLMKDTLEEINKQNPSTNAIVALSDADQLMRQAQRADQTKPTSAVHGIPFAFKDLVNVKGFLSTLGSPLLKNFVPEHDDLVAKRIKDAGAIPIGKTNTPEFGLGSQTFNTIYGVTATPYDNSKTSGGSSGGAAAALASGMLLVADGSDMMGSLRNPAAFCNVYGFRPSYGLIANEPRGDMFLHQLSTLGPMARTVEDMALLLDVMAKPDPRHPHSIQQTPNYYVETQITPKPNQHIAWLGDWGGEIPMEDGIKTLCRDALEIFQRNGHRVTDITPPFSLQALWDSWSVLRSYAVASLLSIFYNDKNKRNGLKPEAIFEIENGLKLTGVDIANASLVRSQWFKDAATLFSTFDVLVLPSSQVWPFDKSIPWPKTINGKTMSSYHKWMEIVVPASLVGLPAINVPAGFSENGLPMGMQLIGARNDDIKLLQLANQYHYETRWPQKRAPN